MKILVVICHPRRDSLTGAMADAFIAGLEQSEHEVEIADLHAEDFDPRMPIADEPDYADPGKVYSEAVRHEMARIERNDAIALFFPVWWWSVPAMLKGWIDRVWNFGWAYGWAEHEAQVPLQKALLIALGGSSRQDFEDNGFDKQLDAQLFGLMNYCGITDSRLELFTDTLDENTHFDLMLARACELGRQFDA